MHDDDTLFNHRSDRIIGCAFGVMNAPGCGFLEKVYENALAHELCNAGLDAARQHPITARYGVHNAQCINHLKASGLRRCRLPNLDKPRVEIHRVANGV